MRWNIIFKYQTCLPSDTHVFVNRLFKGTAGTAVLNSDGIVGVTVGALIENYNEGDVIGIVGMNHVYQCIGENVNAFPTIEHCTRKQPIDVYEPVVLFSIKDNFARLWRTTKELFGLHVPRISPNRVYPKQASTFSTNDL